MPVFHSQLRKIDYSNPAEALKIMANHIKYIQEQLEYTLTNLDSRNVTEIETDVTNITSSGGGVNISGSSIELAGKNGERFTAGMEASGVFRFALNGKNGVQMLYLDTAGQLILTKNTSVSLDGGTW